MQYNKQKDSLRHSSVFLQSMYLPGATQVIPTACSQPATGRRIGPQLTDLVGADDSYWQTLVAGDQQGFVHLLKMLIR